MVTVEVFPGFRLLETIIQTVSVGVPKEWKKIRFDEHLYVTGAEIFSLLYLISDGNVLDFDHLVLGKAVIDLVDTYAEGMMNLSDMALLLWNYKTGFSTTFQSSMNALASMATQIEEQSKAKRNLDLLIKVAKQFSRTQTIVTLLNEIITVKNDIDDYDKNIVDTVASLVTGDPGTFGITEYVIISVNELPDDTGDLYNGIFIRSKHPFRNGNNLETIDFDALQQTPPQEVTIKFRAGVKIKTRRRFRVTLGAAQSDIECVNPISAREGKIVIGELVLRAKLVGVEELDSGLHEMLKANGIHVYVNPARLKYYTARSVLTPCMMTFGNATQTAAPLDIPVDYHKSDVYFGDVLKIPVVDNVKT